MRGPALVLLGILWISGCIQHGETVLGKSPEGTVRRIAAVRKASLDKPVTVRGRMVEK